jgi:toxin ParE1/3/4
MPSDLKQCEGNALKLAPKDRAILAERLISSLDSLEGPENEQLWLEEAERRYKGYRKGKIPARLARDVLRKKVVLFLRPSELEMLDAARYYELQAPGLGANFLDKIDQAVSDIAKDPQKWPIFRFQIRRRLIHRFPFGLLYRIDPD